MCCQGNTHPCAYMHYISRDIHVYVYRYIYIHTKVYINMLAYTVYTYHTVLHTYVLISMFTDILLHLNNVANTNAIVMSAYNVCVIFHARLPVR